MEIWRPIEPITEEDVRHMRERVREFHFVGRIQRRPRGVRRATMQAMHGVVSWILAGATQHDTAAASARPIAPPLQDAADNSQIFDCLADSLQAVRLPRSVATLLTRVVRALGLVHADELRIHDRTALPTFTT